MRSLAGAVTTLLATGQVGVVQLVHLNFAAPIVLNTSTWNLTYSAVTYLGAAGLGTVSAIADKPGEVQGVQWEISGSASNVSLALDGTDVVQGTVMTIRTALLDLTTYTITDAPTEWVGYLDTMAISEDGTTATVRGTAESKEVDLLRGTPASYSDGDQQALYPGDLAFDLVVSQAGNPVVWPAREWFFKK